MRLIDADALLRELREELGVESPMLTDDQNEGIDCGLRIAIKDVKSQPTIDPESLRPTGEWICLEPEIGLFACSECDHRILRAKCNYCPNCGAKMQEAPCE